MHFAHKAKINKLDDLLETFPLSALHHHKLILLSHTFVAEVESVLFTYKSTQSGALFFFPLY